VRIRFLNIFLLVVLVFAFSRLWTFLGEPPPALPEIDAGAPPSVADTTGRGKPSGSNALQPEAYDVIVARDLFSPTRGVVPPAPTAAIKPAAKQQPPPKLTLSGVVILDGEKTAYLQEGTQESRPRKVRENEKFAGGVVKTIRPDGVTFLFAGSEINLPLRKPQTGPGTPSPRVQSVGRVVPRAVAPATAPRRLTPTGIQQGRLPVPGQPARSGNMSAVAPPDDFEDEYFEDEEFPEDYISDEEDLDMMEEEEEEEY